jgi:hypothetical protein
MSHSNLDGIWLIHNSKACIKQAGHWQQPISQGCKLWYSILSTGEQWGHPCFAYLRGRLDPWGALGKIWAYPCIWRMQQGMPYRVMTWASTWFPLQRWYSLLLRYQEVSFITVIHGCAVCKWRWVPLQQSVILWVPSGELTYFINGLWQILAINCAIM